jgi:hypothetical protein
VAQSLQRLVPPRSAASRINRRSRALEIRRARRIFRKNTA